MTWKPYDTPPDISSSGYLVGTSGYYFDDWIGLFNPPKSWRPLTEDQRSFHDRLQFYQRYFSFVEINTTFYREPMLSQFVEIERRSKQSMMYTVKVFRDISHTREYDSAAGTDMMRRHITAVSPLTDTGRFYSFLIQLEDHVFRSQKRLDYLLTVSSEAKRNDLDVHIEFRHISWHTQQVLQSLKDSGIGICNTEIPPIPHAFPLKSYATTDKGYVRYSGRNLAHWNGEWGLGSADCGSKSGQRSAVSETEGSGPGKNAGMGPRTGRVTSRERLQARNMRYDYLYSDEELTTRVEMQQTLRTKASQVAIAYNNHYETKAVLNAIETIKRLEASLKEDERSSSV